MKIVNKMFKKKIFNSENEKKIFKKVFNFYKNLPQNNWYSAASDRNTVLSMIVVTVGWIYGCIKRLATHINKSLHREKENSVEN